MIVEGAGASALGLWRLSGFSFAGGRAEKNKSRENAKEKRREEEKKRREESDNTHGGDILTLA